MNEKGSFDLDQELETTGIIAIHYEKAFVTMGIADLRGIKNQIQFKWNKKTLKIEPGSALSPIIKSGVTIKIPELSDNTSEVFGFEFNLDLQGSKELNFIPLGGITEVSLQSTWEAPSFKGKFLPDSRKVSKDGFQANWKVLELNKNFPSVFCRKWFF
jgi:inner membrane protein